MNEIELEECEKCHQLVDYTVQPQGSLWSICLPCHREELLEEGYSLEDDQ